MIYLFLANNFIKTEKSVKKKITWHANCQAYIFEREIFYGRSKLEGFV